MKRYLVWTHLGGFETVAKSAARAKSNIRFRLFGTSGDAKKYTDNWKVEEV